MRLKVCMWIVHHNDSDGRCAAAIMAQYARNHGFVPQFKEMDYKDCLGPLDFLDKTDVVAMVDFSLKPDVVEEIRKRVGMVIWCDHHVTAKAYPYQDLPGFRDFSDKGLSGCECTWRYCFPTMPIPMAARLLGDYDAWRLEQQPQCFEFYEGLKLEDCNPASQMWDGLLELNEGVGYAAAAIQNVMSRGRSAILYRDNYCAGLRKSFGYETEIAGHRAYALNAYMFGSRGHGEKFGEFPVCIAYIHDGVRFTVSLYSETVDVSVIAKGFGGGGHKGAAGFVCETLPFARKG